MCVLCMCVVCVCCVCSVCVCVVFVCYSLAQPVILEQLVRMICFEPNEDVADKVKFK